MKIINLTPHPVTIHRPSGATSYPPCDPASLPRATEAPTTPIMLLAESGDGQAGYATSVTLDECGLVDNLGYTGVEGLPETPPADLAFGCTTFYVVSVVTAIGALASGRAIVDLLIPMGQVRGPDGRIIGATSLAPAATLLSPMVQRVIDVSDGRAPQHPGRAALMAERAEGPSA